MRLSEDLRKWRADRPDEWTMDRFINEATRLELVEEKFTSTNTARDEILPLLERGIRYSEANGLGSVKSIFQQIAAKLSPVA